MLNIRIDFCQIELYTFINIDPMIKSSIYSSTSKRAIKGERIVWYII